MQKVDVHHHIHTLGYTQALEESGGDPSGWPTPQWTLASDDALCEAINVTTSIFSVTAPGVTTLNDKAQAVQLARELNEYCAGIRDSNPSKYGFFATLPNLLETSPCLEEIAYSLDVLKADGVCLYTRYGGDNHYLGHPDFRPIWAELHRRKAVVFIHPTHSVDTHWVNPYSPQPLYDYPHETTRAAMDLIMRGNMRDFPDCKIILSHAGGTLPYLIHRMSMIKDGPFGDEIDRTKAELVEDARQFYFDLALSGNSIVMGALLAFAKPGHILFGSDFPYAPEKTIKANTQGVEQFEMDEKTRREVNYESAGKLFPRLKGVI